SRTILPLLFVCLALLVRPFVRRARHCHDASPHGRQWGAAIRALATAAFRNLPMMALLFVPVVIGLHDIYAWTNSATGPHKAQYLTAPFFIARSVVYFVILISLAFALRERDTTALSAGGLIAYVLCMNFASTDWVMSLDPEWYSSIFVEIFAAGQFLSA